MTPSKCTFCHKFSFSLSLSLSLFICLLLYFNLSLSLSRFRSLLPFTFTFIPIFKKANFCFDKLHFQPPNLTCLVRKTLFLFGLSYFLFAVGVRSIFLTVNDVIKFD